MSLVNRLGDDLEARSAAACAIVREAGNRARAAFLDRGRLVVSTKGTQDWVSNVDVEVEQLIRSRLRTRFPGETVLGEEDGHDGAPDAASLWVVDPIDGTTCFLLGIPQWCVALAHVVEGAPQVAAIYDPMADDLYHATLGGGAWLNGAPIRASAATSVGDGLISIGASFHDDPAKSARFMQGLVADGGMYLRIGACALALCYVASGRLLAMFEPRVSPWDDLAGLLIVREAGGRTNPLPERIVSDERHRVVAAADGIWPAMAPLI